MKRLDRALARAVHRGGGSAATLPADLRPLHARIDALEAMVEALQDSVDRQARHNDERIEELKRALEPRELARRLSDDARKRGL